MPVTTQAINSVPNLKRSVIITCTGRTNFWEDHVVWHHTNPGHRHHLHSGRRRSCRAYPKDDSTGTGGWGSVPSQADGNRVLILVRPVQYSRAPEKPGGALAKKASALATLQDSCLTGAGVESGLFAAECVHYHSEHRKSFCPLIFSSQLSSAAMAPKIYIVPHCTPAVLNIWASCALSVLPCTPAGWN